MAEDEVAIRITLRNAQKFAADAKRSSQGIKDVGTSARVAGIGLASVSTAGKAAGAGLRSVGTEARYAAFGVGALAAAGAKWGIDFNAGVESSSVALKTLLGSQEAANRELKAGQEIAKSSALLNFRDTAKAQQMLIGTGVQAQLTRQLLEGTSDAMVALGRDPAEFQQVVRAFGQIQSKGKLMGDEVTQQLGEVFPAARILKEELGLTEKQMANLGAQGIDSTTALTALANGLKKDFGGAAEDAEGTWTALMSRIKDDSQQAFGAATKSTFDWAEKAVLPAADKAAQAITEIFGRKGLSNEQKIQLAGQAIVRHMAPVWDDVSDAISAADIPGKLGDVVKAATPKVLDAAADVGKSAAGAFVTGWLHAGPWAQFLTVAFLGNKLRKSDLGKALGAKGGAGGVAGSLLGTRGATPANPVFVSEIGGGGKGGGGVKDKAKDAAKVAAGPVAQTVAAVGGAEGLILGLSALFPLGGILGLALTHNENFKTRGPGASSPSNPAGSIPPPGFGNTGGIQQNNINVDGRRIASVMTPYTQIETARGLAAASARK